MEDNLHNENIIIYLGWLCFCGSSGLWLLFEVAGTQETCIPVCFDSVIAVVTQVN